MAKNIPNVDLLTETYGTWLNRTNSVIDTIATEVITANTTLGITGTPLIPVYGRLWGGFTANNLTATTSLDVSNILSVNSSRIVINGPIQANGSFGSSGQLLTSNGSGIYWSSASGIGTVTRINTNLDSGLVGGPITSVGNLSVRAGPGITVNNAGVSVNTAWLSTQSLGNASSLQNKTWADPNPIGSSIPNSGAFTTLTVNSTINVNTYFTVSASSVRTSGFLDGTTPSDASTGGLRVRSNSSDLARIQITNPVAGSQYGVANINSSGLWTWSGDMKILNGIDVGYRNVPQVIATSTTINTTNDGGKHFYLPSGSTLGVSLSIPDNTADPSPIGTAITIVNGSSSAQISIFATGAAVLQLAGTTTTGARSVGPGGLATILKVESNKWFISGVGVS